MFKGLRDRDYAREGLFVCEGRLVIEKALDSGFKLSSLISVPADGEYWKAKLPDYGHKPDIVSSMSRSDMEKLLGFAFHRGSVALAHRPRLHEFGEATWGQTSNRGLTPERGLTPGGHGLVLWNITDPDNFGTLVRSGAALGAGWLGIGPGTTDPFGRKTLRTSMGCVLSLPILVFSDASQLKMLPGPVLAAAISSEVVNPVGVRPQFGLNDKNEPIITLILGNEGYGLPGDVIDAATGSIQIPMLNSVDSLNVASAGAILMWELFGRRFD